MNFSIVFPTRERPHLLKKLLYSIADNTEDLSKVEVFIAIDEDDMTDYEVLEAFSFVKYFRVKRSLNFSKDYYSFLAKQSTGQWVIAVNDDCVFETPNWDSLAYEVLKDKPGVIYGWSEDGLGEYRAHGHGNYCCFPLQGRAGIEAMGCFFPARIPTWGADIWIKGLYDQVQAVVHLPITIRHFCHHNKTREQDDISKRIASHQVGFDVRPTYEEVNLLLKAKRNACLQKQEQTVS